MAEAPPTMQHPAVAHGSTVTLLVRHLPEAIPHDTLTRLFSHYGASSVRPCSHGRVKNCAFVDFKNETSASQAQKQLHGYAYPPPDGNILTNIVNALIAVPRFYTQVLHLMNKMNIPAPFRKALPTPPLPVSVPVPSPPPPPSSETNMEHLSSSESEMESSDEIKIVPKQVQPEPRHDDAGKEVQEPRLETLDHEPYVTLEELNSGKLPPEEILSLPRFKNYTAGDPSPVLYIKNLAKDVVVDDFYFIFGSLFGSIDAAKSNLSVKLMQEGRMRGQAFITFPTVELARNALNVANGYVFKGKPIVIQFGRNPAAAKAN
ncbi:UNVERIFIED_CONTAM: U11/U12 small nuclear ribonucleoprotein [Sesamum radiatum]|uniref:U11/U12 small nuclear ribonucleoprotein n=1 Tax=Sesamum radiatum TaxID=300843 RepID=A0AAW2MWT0_SESRA